jgi:fructosamine-3-kinase
VNLPRDIAAAVEAALSRGSRATRIRNARAVSGGCISPAAQLQFDAGEPAFLKWAQNGIPAGLFAEEARSLSAMAATGAVRVPAVLAVDARWLLLEWLEPGRAGREDWARLGRQLAGLHAVHATAFGWQTANFIGPLPQSNEWCEDWPRFWREQRLEPLLRGAVAKAALDAPTRRAFETVIRTLDQTLGDAQPDGASLLHGDLWSGNVHAMRSGHLALIDPSSYHGHREVDLAMAELFGGFPQEFFDAYQEAWPLQPGYHELRRWIYQLYYLLVHVVLFGGGYAASTRAVVERVVALVR